MEKSIWGLTLTGLVALTIVLIANDLITWWPGAELDLVFGARLEDQSGADFVSLFYGYWASIWPTPFGMRFPGAILFILAAAGSYLWSYRLFGTETAVLAVSLLLAGWLPVWSAKTVSGDVWLLAAHGLAWVAMIRAAKQPRWYWFALVGLLIFWGAWIRFWPSVVFVGAFLGYSWFFYSGGKRLLPLALALVPAWFLREPNGWQFWPMGWILLTVAPLFGLVLAGLRETLQRWRKGEEMSRLMAGSLLAVLLSQSPAFGVVIAFLAGRQLGVLFHPNYPHRQLVRAGHILYLLAVFFAGTGAMILGFQYFQGPGFRSAMAISAALWIGGVVAAIGLYGNRPAYVRRGLLGGWLAALFLAFTLGGPLLETRRNLPYRAVQGAMDMGPAEINLSVSDKALEKQIKLELQEAVLPAGQNTVLISDKAEVDARIETGWLHPGQDDTLWISGVSVHQIHDQ